MRMSLPWRAAVLAAPLLGSAVALGAQEVFVRVPVELGGTAVRVTLPFGEPFLLVGVAPRELHRVEARYLEWRDAPPDEGRCRAVLDSVALGVRPWIRDAKLKADSFAVLVSDGLSANRRYALCMQTRQSLDSLSLSAFQARAHQILESTYAALDAPGGEPPTDLTEHQIDSLRRKLARALPRTKGQAIDAAETIFDTTGAKVTEANLVFTTDVLVHRTERLNAAKSWMGAASQARTRLGGFAASPALRAIASRITSRDRISGIDPVRVERAAATARMLASPDLPLIRAVSEGEAVLAPGAVVVSQSQDPLVVTDPAEVAARSARIDSTYQRLTELRELVAALEASSALRRKTGVTQAQAGALRASLDATRESFAQVRTAASRWSRAHESRRALLQRAARSLRVAAENDVSLVGTSISNFETRARQYVTADLGVAYAPGLGEAAPYFGANFYLGALNKRVPITFTRRELDRWALTIGVTATSLARKNVRDDLFSSYSLLLGAGRRMTDAVRLTGGAVVYRDRDDNPLVDDTSPALSPFVSLSFDFDARGALGRLSDILFK